jgi:hypothetical protein
MRITFGEVSPELMKRLEVYLDGKLLDDEHYAITQADDKEGFVRYWLITPDGTIDAIKFLRTGKRPRTLKVFPKIITARGRVEFKGRPWEWDDIAASRTGFRSFHSLWASIFRRPRFQQNRLTAARQ